MKGNLFDSILPDDDIEIVADFSVLDVFEFFDFQMAIADMRSESTSEREKMVAFQYVVETMDKCTPQSLSELSIDQALKTVRKLGEMFALWCSEQVNENEKES